MSLKHRNFVGLWHKMPETYIIYTKHMFCVYYIRLLYLAYTDYKNLKKKSVVLQKVGRVLFGI